MSPHVYRGPSPLLPLAFMSLAAAAFVLAALGVPWLATELTGHYYHPRVLALVHTVTLGWITLTIFGASYQLIPVTGTPSEPTTGQQANRKADNDTCQRVPRRSSRRAMVPAGMSTMVGIGQP